MLESYNRFNELIKELKEGDLVAITYKDSKYYNQVGNIFYIDKNYDCKIHLLYGEMVTFYITNLIKVNQLIEMPSGEVFFVPQRDIVYIAAVGLIQYDFNKKIYTFKEDNKWEIEEYMI